MTLQEIKDSAEAFIEGKKSVILPLQQAWIDTHDKFWQGLRTPTILPQDGAELPTDQTLARYPMPSWFSFGLTLPSVSPFSISCDEIVSHDCDDDCRQVSFSLATRFVFDNTLYARRSNWCEESGWVDYPWDVQEPPE